VTNNTLYTWILTPTRIEDKEQAVRFLDALLESGHFAYSLGEIKPVLDIIVWANNLLLTEYDFEFSEYGDYFLYAMLFVEGFSPYYLYVFCAGHRIYFW